jgi:hypothetical protein
MHFFSVKEFYKSQTNCSTSEEHQQVKLVMHMVQAVNGFSTVPEVIQEPG